MYCDETSEDLTKMRNRIQLAKETDPEYVNKCFKLPIYTELVGYGFFGDIKMLHPVHHAAAWGHFKCVQNLIEAGASANEVTREGFNAIHFAIYHGYRNGEDEKNNDLVKYLLKHNVAPLVIDRKPQFNKTYLIDCCVYRNNIDMLKILLECGLPIEEFIKYDSGEICVPDKTTPLILSIKYNKLEAFTILLYYGATLVWYPSEYDRRVSFYSIPHYCLRNYKNPNMILSLLEIYQQFGGNMWIKDTIDSGGSSDRLLLTNVMSESERLHNVIADIQEMICNPMKLQSMCRILIRKLMGRNYWCNINKLPLPNDIKEFLKYSDFLIQ